MAIYTLPSPFLFWGNIASLAEVVTARNIRGRELLYRETPDETYYYLPDAHGDIIGLTDGMGNITKSYAYDPFGNQETPALQGFGLNSTVTLWQNEVEKADNPFGYCGEYLDEESGLIYLRGRYYDPGLARFTQEDPTKNGFNWYAYCGNNPVNCWDPSGLVEVGLRSYADTYEGSTVAWDNETKTATVTYNGITLSVKSTAQNNVDGHIYVDDSVLNNYFGWGSTLTPGMGTTKLTNVKNDVNIDLKGGWQYRYEVGDPNNPGNSSHMHLFQTNGKQSYSQNDDGSPKDGPKGGDSPPKSILKALKEKTGWDWNKKHKNWLSKIEVGYNDAGVYQIQYPNGRKVTVYPHKGIYLPIHVTDQYLTTHYFGPTHINLIDGKNTETIPYVLPTLTTVPVTITAPITVLP